MATAPVFAVSSATLAALVGAAAVLVGASLSIAVSVWLWHRERSERRRDERRAAYETLLVAVQVVAYRIGNIGDEDYGPAATDRQEAAYLLGTEVTPKVRTTQLIVPARLKVVDAALDLRKALGAFLDGMTLTESPPKYRSAEYTAIYDPVVKVRDHFITIAGEDLDT